SEPCESDFFSSYSEQDIVLVDQSKSDLSSQVAEHKQVTITPKIEEIPIPFSSEISYIDQSEYKDSYEELNANLLTKKIPVLQNTDDLEDQKNDLELPKITNSSELLYIPNKTPEWVQKELSFLSQEGMNNQIEDNSEKSLNITTKNSPLDEDKLFKMTNIVSWNESFDINVKISSPSNQSGYVFSISIDPKQNMAYEKIPQNFYFLIDSSHTVDRHKFSLYKRAVTKALSSLREGDRFNIIVLDKKLSRLSNKTIVYNIRSQQLAEDFIDKVSHNNIITSANLLDSLEKISSFIQNDDEMHTAILLTTGQVNQSLKNQQKSFKTFIEKNSNKFSLYAAAVGNKNNLVNLDMLCNLSGGRLLYSDTNASFPRKLASMIKTLRFPIAKDVKVTAVATNAKARLNLVSNQNHLPPFYANEPYTIIGNIERLCDINLTIEAKHDDEWVCIQKTISFNDAVVDEKLVKQWNKAIVTAEYESFLKEPKGKHIKKAKEILQDTYGRSALE
ncbi:MAG: VWA domain-containing protein, partial [Chlamydiae bacterium]|nr:VWA domain-containing protein [Chlamydiota bacterium]